MARSGNSQKESRGKLEIPLILRNFVAFCYRDLLPKGMAARGKVKGLYLKWDFWYWQPPTPKDGSGRPKPINLKTQDYVTAVGEVASRIQDGRLTEAAGRGTVDKLLPKYHAAKRGDKAHTRRMRECVLASFSKALNNPRVHDITPEMMSDWIEELKKRPAVKRSKTLSPASVKSYLIAVRAFLNWAREQRLIREDPAKHLKRYAKVKGTKVQDFFTEEQREKILAAKMDPPVRLMLLAGFFAGLRYQEVMAMNPKWIWISPDGTKGSITVQDTPITFEDGTESTWQPKDMEKRAIPMHARLLEFFKEHGNPGPWTVRPDRVHWSKKPQGFRYNARHTLKKLEIECGVGGLNFHKLRHSFGSLLAMKGTPIVTIAALLGDGIQVTEEHYVGFIPGRENPLAVL